MPHRYRSQLRGASTVRLISHLPATNTCCVPNEMGHHGKRSCVLFAACTRSRDRFGHSSRFVFGSCYGGIVALFPAISRRLLRRPQCQRHHQCVYTNPPPTPACRPASSARTFSGRAVSGIARAACGLTSAARRTERQVNADRHMRTSSRLDPARRAMSTHHARASSARMPRRRDGRLPCSKRAVSILQLWCNLKSMHVDTRLALSQLLGLRRVTWPRKRRRQRRQRRQPRRKRSNRSTKPLSIRIASEVRYALCGTDRPQLSPTEYPR
jgi:hypothetical protein